MLVEARGRDLTSLWQSICVAGLYGSKYDRLSANLTVVIFNMFSKKDDRISSKINSVTERHNLDTKTETSKYELETKYTYIGFTN